MQVIVISAAIIGGSIWAYTENHHAISRFTIGVFSSALRAIGLI